MRSMLQLGIGFRVRILCSSVLIASTVGCVSTRIDEGESTSRIASDDVEKTSTAAAEKRVESQSPSRISESTTQTDRLGYSVQNRPIEIRILGCSPSQGETVLILATIHGNEAAGTPLLSRLEHHLELHPELLADHRVVLLPVANPDGMASSIRGNKNGIDLNRNFPASNFRASNKGTGRDHGLNPLSQPESKILHDLIVKIRPSRILSIHQPLSCIDYDGPAKELANALGQHTDLPVKKLGGRPGSLGSFAGINLGIPIITLELPNSASNQSPEELWTRYGALLLSFVRFPDGVS